MSYETKANPGRKRTPLEKAFDALIALGEEVLEERERDKLMADKGKEDQDGEQVCISRSR